MDHVFEFVKVVGAFLLVLGPLIVIHEFGHFIAAKSFGIGVPVFSIGLGPRLFGVRRGGTDYRISAIPLGGYVRLHGDEADEHRSGAPEEFLSRPRWQRFVVYVAGATLNIVLALFLVFLVLLVWGVDEVPVPEDAHPVVVRVYEGSPAEAAGVELGDRLLEVAGRDARDSRALMSEIQLSPDSVVQLLVGRGGEQVRLQLEPSPDPKYRLGDPGWETYPDRTPGQALISQVLDGPAKQAGLRTGDVIVGAGGQRPIGLVDLHILLAGNAGKTLLLDVRRGEELLEIPVTPRSERGQGMIGVSLGSTEVVHRDFSVGEALAASLRINVEMSTTLFVVLDRVARRVLREVLSLSMPNSLRAFSGPIEIAQISFQAVTGGVQTLLGFLAFISLQLGILNLMPIPVLDGGHILILGIEGAMRRDLSQRIKERVIQVGLLFLLAFFGLIITFDLIKTASAS